MITDQKKAWFLAARPKTLTAAIAPILVAASLCIHDGFSIDYILFVCSILSSICIQIATNFLNDAYDYFRGADKDRLGPARMSQNGILEPNKIILVAFALLLLSALIAVPLILKGGWLVALMVSASISCAYLYTGGPVPLAYKGLGEIFVIFFFGVFSIPVFYYIQTLTFSWNALLAGAQIGSLCAVIISINNLRDMNGDVIVNKRTLAVRFGAYFAKMKIALLLYLPYLLSFFWLTESTVTAFLPCFTFFLAKDILKQIMSSTSDYNIPFVESAKLHFLFSISLAASILL